MHMQERYGIVQLLAAAGLLLAPGPGVRAEAEAETGAGTVTVVIVRHAEKVDDSRDPPLSDAGRERARALAGVLADAGLDAAWASQYLRTQATAAPAADAAGIDVRIAPIEGDIADWARQFSRTLIERHRGQTVLVVGHSNTVPVLVGVLCGCDVDALADTDYDRLFIVQRSARGEAGLIQARYGR